MAPDTLSEQLVKYLARRPRDGGAGARADARGPGARRGPPGWRRRFEFPLHRDRATRGADSRTPSSPRRHAVADRGPARQAQRQGVHAVRASRPGHARQARRRTPTGTSTWSSPRTTCSRRWPSGRGTRRPRPSRGRSGPRRRRWRCGSASSGTGPWRRRSKSRDAAETARRVPGGRARAGDAVRDAARQGSEARGHARARADPREPPRRDQPPPRAPRAPARGSRRVTQPREGRRAEAGRAELGRLLGRAARHAGQAGDVRLRRRAASRSARTSDFTRVARLAGDGETAMVVDQDPPRGTGGRGVRLRARSTRRSTPHFASSGRSEVG